MQTYLREASLEEPVIQHLQGLSFQALLREAPFYDYRIDLLAFSFADNASVAVELKLSNWRRAFEQAIVYQLCVDFAFVAMPQEAIDKINRSLFEEHGIGLIAVSRFGACDIVIPAQQSQVLRQDYRSELLALLPGHA